MWYSRQGDTRVERRDRGFRNTWRRLLWAWSSLPPSALLASLAVWTLLLWSTTPGYGQSSNEWRISARHCSAEPIPPTLSALD